ncbi:hypothetical protein LWF01_05255 [Saxibacter everestensis]|uniref:Uncharacterized protein n=1 Tax=Saxibacter everestensis TaxID=2909229 RepID=A0ABY8QW15_9MICO|nr:hypothetical protein LWF01_05255 [Brevibacteriaceae bacterium ZFBP1038]
MSEVPSPQNVPAPESAPETSGDAEVDAVIERIDQVAELPLKERPEAFNELYRQLSAQLDEQ